MTFDTSCAYDVSVSLVSHGHGDLVLQALKALARGLRARDVRVQLWLTFNLPEPALRQQVSDVEWPFALHCIDNDHPQGFGANHNQAFARAHSNAGSQWFVVMNPDVYWPPHADSFWAGLQHDVCPSDVGLVSPGQVDMAGQPQDFARKLMTPWGLLARVWRRWRDLPPSGVSDSVAEADWVNGACMVFRTQAFAAIGGFDERYFMYCEDTDICLRLQLAGWQLQGADLTVIHDAQRNTARSWRHLRWHIASMLRLWTSQAFWRFVLRNTQRHTARLGDSR